MRTYPLAPQLIFNMNRWLGAWSLGGPQGVPRSTPMGVSRVNRMFLFFCSFMFFVIGVLFQFLGCWGVPEGRP